MKVTDLQGSMNLLMSSMVDIGRKVMCETFGMQKPRWLSQTERFESFFSQLCLDDSGLENFKTKFVFPLFDSHSLNLTCSIINTDDVIQDDFIKVKSTSTLSLKTTPNGLYLHNADGKALKSLYLPISDAYSSAVDMAIKDKQKNVDLPVKILLGLYGMLYHGLSDHSQVSKDDLKSLQSNITVLQEYLEEISCDIEEDTKQRSSSDPMGMIKNLLGNVNFDQIGEMMDKVTNDQEASTEFKNVFGKMTAGIQEGKAPLDVMTDIIKEATESDPDHQSPVTDNETTPTPAEETTAEAETAVEETTSTSHN